MAGQAIFSVKELTGSLGDELNSRGAAPEMSITSMPQLNSKLWGIRRGKLTIIGARTSHGKSSFVMQVAKDLALQNFKVLFLSLEMSNSDMAERLFCNMCEVDNTSLQQGRFADHRGQYLEWCKKVTKLNLVFSDCLGRTWHEIDSLISSMPVKPDVVILDYIQAIKGLGTMERGVMDEYIKKFREMAVIHNYAGIICSQINRGSEHGKDNRPQLHQLKNTGFLEEHADVVILLHWPYKSDPDANKDEKKFVLELAKNRNGRTGYFFLFYHPEFYKFKDPQSKKDVKLEDMDPEVRKAVSLFGGHVVEGGIND